jgi:NAD(P)-dependent dehydrogenase (short-subunit alcohol dehydrogenase family)
MHCVRYYETEGGTKVARILITGSADGLGQMAAQRLVKDGHQVVLHARNERRANEAMRATPGAETVLAGDLSTLDGMRRVAEGANALGTLDAVIHNAAVGYQEPRTTTKDGLEHVFAINTVAPYLLTALISQPSRLVFLSSGLHRSGGSRLDDLNWTSRPWNGLQAYSDSKLHDVLLAFAVARLWPKTYSNALEPGWVATKMGGPGAPDDLAQGSLTQAWLAAGADAATQVTGKYFYHQKLAKTHPDAGNVEVQDALLDACARATGVRFPAQAAADSTLEKR